jgi:hypothetical protein
MDIALTILALIQGGALVHFHYKYHSLSASHALALAQLAKTLDAVTSLNSAIVKNEPNEKIKVLEQKVAVLQLKK